MCVRVPPHLGHAGDDAAVTMLALNPDRRIVIGGDGTRWALWPVHEHATAVPHAALAGSRTVRAFPEGGGARTIALPEGLALGQLTDQEILDLLARGHRQVDLHELFPRAPTGMRAWYRRGLPGGERAFNVLLTAMLLLFTGGWTWGIAVAAETGGGTDASERLTANPFDRESPPRPRT